MIGRYYICDYCKTEFYNKYYAKYCMSCRDKVIKERLARAVKEKRARKKVTLNAE